MKPIKLKLCGFEGIASGRGKNEIEVDFSAIPEEAKMVALVGPNGAGKSTIMDTSQPYRVMPSRSSKATPSAFSYKDHVLMGDSGLVFDWSHDGIVYRSDFSFRKTAKTFKQDCFLFVVSDDQAAPWNDPVTGLTSDGKTDNYDKCVEAILGKPEVFFTAQFSAQGKQPIGHMSAGEVKTLLGQMLGMEKIVELGVKASTVTKELKPHLGAAQEMVLRLQRDRPDAELLGQQRVQQESQEDHLLGQQDRVRKQRDAAIERLSVVKQELAQQEGIKAQHLELQGQLDGCQRGRVLGKERALAEKQRHENAALDSQLQQAASAVNVAGQRVGDLRKQISTQQALAAQAPALNAEREKLVQLEVRRGAQTAIITEHEPVVLRLGSIRNELMGLKESLVKAESDGTHIAAALNNAQATALLLGEVPCHGTALTGRCKLLGEANKAAAEIIPIQIKLGNARTMFKDTRITARSREQEIAAMVDAEAKIKQAREALVEIDSGISACQNALARQPFVDVALEQLPLLQAQAQQAQHELDCAQQAQAQVKAQLSQHQGRQSAERAELKQECDRELSRLQAAKASLPAISSNADAQTAQQALDDANRLEQSITVQLQALSKAMLDTQTQVNRAREVDLQLAQAQERVDEISAEISRWILLTKAFGTDGIVAMQIDDAGPAIAAITNTLLSDCYGGRFQITLVTQAQTTSGITKEAFLIQVEDTHRGEIKLLDYMSGGEKVWINECLVRGIALYVAQTADARYETLFSDENDGALDPERKRQYMEMQKAVVERGGYSREYIITHTPELLNLCDAVIDVSSL